MNTTTPSIGTWLSTGSPVIAELAALSGFDWVLLDLEHGNESEASLPNQLRGLRGTRTRGIVRVGAPHADLIARVLDWGAHGIMVPHVNSAAEARRICSSILSITPTPTWATTRNACVQSSPPRRLRARPPAFSFETPPIFRRTVISASRTLPWTWTSRSSANPTRKSSPLLPDENFIMPLHVTDK
jgi:hypothetical protein